MSWVSSSPVFLYFFRIPGTLIKRMRVACFLGCDSTTPSSYYTTHSAFPDRTGAAVACPALPSPAYSCLALPSPALLPPIRRTRCCPQDAFPPTHPLPLVCVFVAVVVSRSQEERRLDSPEPEAADQDDLAGLPLPHDGPQRSAPLGAGLPGLRGRSRLHLAGPAQSHRDRLPQQRDGRLQRHAGHPAHPAQGGAPACAGAMGGARGRLPRPAARLPRGHVPALHPGRSR